ncbi:MAG: hypothetical protein F4234_07360 [Gammaproteobacteria bacterium]|nr:hypothetical protein [Gammaproteobacteria bacterium]
MNVSGEAPLAEVCTIVGGGTPRRSNAAYYDGTIPWATPTDVTKLDSLFVERTKEAITEVGLNESSARLVPAGTVLMTSRATIGYTAIATRPMATNQGFANLICGERVLPEYLAYWLRDQRELLIQLAGGTTFKELPKSTLKKVRIPLPPLEEQRRIVGILNRAAKLERLRKQAQERLREFIPALFIKMFGDPADNPKGWEVRPLGALCIQTQYGTSKRATDQADGLPVLRMGNVTYSGDLDCANLKWIDLSENDTEKYLLRKGDLLFNRTNSKELVGKTGVWDGRFDAVAASYFIRLRLDENSVCPIYVWAFMNSAATKQRLFATARGAIGQANINAEEVKSLPLPVPPLDLQRTYSELAEKAQSELKTTESCCVDVSELQGSLMSRFLDIVA